MQRTLMLSLIIACSGCFHLSVQRGDPRPTVSSVDIKVHSFLFMMIPGPQLAPTRKICVGTTVEKIKINMSALDVLTSVATAGLYTPHHVTISCSAATEMKTAPSSSPE